MTLRNLLVIKYKKPLNHVIINNSLMDNSKDKKETTKKHLSIQENHQSVQTLQHNQNRRTLP